MKNLLKLFLTFYSLSSYASADCTYVIMKFKGSHELMLHAHTENIVNKRMQMKGYVQVFDPEAARFHIGSNVLIDPIKYSIYDLPQTCSAEVVLTLFDNSHGASPFIKTFVGKAEPFFDGCPSKKLIKKAMRNAVEKIPSCFF